MTFFSGFCTPCPKLRSTVILVTILFALPFRLIATVLPTENAVLNYRIIGFSFPARQDTKEYVLEIARTQCNTEAEFASNIVQKTKGTNARFVAEVPDFGAAYTWRIVYMNDRTVVGCSRFYHFTTGKNPVSDKRLIVKTKKHGNIGGYILVDGTGLIYDIDGKPVWYLPDASLHNGTDMKLSQTGTLTLMANGNAYELNYSGKVQWSTAKHDSIDLNCHHEFCKLSNGHYMALTASLKPTQTTTTGDKRRFYPTMSVSTLAEFDEAGNIVWTWKGEDYMQQSDLLALQNYCPEAIVDLHENAFYFDEKNSIIYLSMAGISRIVKISYPSGKVIKEYGRPFTDNSIKCIQDGQNTKRVQEYFAANNFSNQHAITLAGDGTIYTISNNIVITGDEGIKVYPWILKFRETGDSLQTIWDFDYRLIAGDIQLRPGGGGNIVPMSGSRLFVSNCTPYDDMFILDSNKNVLWHAIPEICPPSPGKCQQFSKYRAVFISRKQLEHFIWAGSKHLSSYGDLPTNAAKSKPHHRVAPCKK